MNMSSHVDIYDCLFKEYLEVRESEHFGRGVYSKKTIVPGVELISSDPIVHVVGKKERGQLCDWCTEKKQGRLRKCSRCKYMYYCGPECQKKDWQFHKFECNGIQKISPNVPTDSVRLIVRLLTKTSHPSPLPRSLIDQGMKKETDILVSHAPRYSEELRESLATQVMGAKLLMAEEDFNGEEVYRIASKLACNTFHILDNEMMTVGSAMYLAPTFINHSCDPNCLAVFEGTRVKVRSIKTIKSGEQLFIGYCELLDTEERRRKYLQKYHLFTCECERCHGDRTGGETNRLMSLTKVKSKVEENALMKAAYDVLEECIKLKDQMNWTELKTTATKFVTKNLNLLGPMHIVIVKMREHIMDAHIELSEWDEALEVANELLSVYVYYPQINPFLGLHYYKMTKLTNQIKDDSHSLKESMSLLDKSIGTLSITHGSDHPLVSEGKGLMADLSCELTSRQNKSKN